MFALLFSTLSKDAWEKSPVASLIDFDLELSELSSAEIDDFSDLSRIDSDLEDKFWDSSAVDLCVVGESNDSLVLSNKSDREDLEL